jgi:hypothetical protein
MTSGLREEFARLREQDLRPCALQRLDDARGGEFDEARVHVVVAAQLPMRQQQPFGDQFIDHRFAERRVHAEVVAQRLGAHACTLRRQADHARKDASRGRAQRHRVHAEIAAIRGEGPCFHR